MYICDVYSCFVMFCVLAASWCSDVEWSAEVNGSRYWVNVGPPGSRYVFLDFCLLSFRLRATFWVLGYNGRPLNFHFCCSNAKIPFDSRNMSRETFVEFWKHLRAKIDEQIRILEGWLSVPKSSKYNVVETWNVYTLHALYLYTLHALNLLCAHFMFLLLSIGLILVSKDSHSKYLVLEIFVYWPIRPSNHHKYLVWNISIFKMYFNIYLVKSNRNEIYMIGHFSLIPKMVALSIKGPICAKSARIKMI